MSTSVLSRPALGDVALAVAIFVAALVAAGSGEAAWLYGLVAVGTLSLALRRHYAVQVMFVVVAITAFAEMEHDSWWPFAALIAFYSVGAHCARRTAAAAGAAGLLILTVAVAFQVDLSPLGWDDLATMTGRLAPVVAAWVLGDNMRTRRQYMRALEDRAEQLEREQEANARRAAAEEQARIAREVHDVVAHTLSVIIVQATAADAVFVSDPDDARRAVGTIGRSARRALGELRQVLDRGDDRRSASFAPQPDLGRLDGLLDQVRLGRPGGRARDRRGAAGARPRTGALGLPDRAGGAHEHAPACGRRPRASDAALQPGRARYRDPRQRHRYLRRKRKRWAGADRHARTRGDLRRTRRGRA